MLAPERSSLCWKLGRCRDESDTVDWRRVGVGSDLVFVPSGDDSTGRPVKGFDMAGDVGETIGDEVAAAAAASASAAALAAAAAASASALRRCSSL